MFRQLLSFSVSYTQFQFFSPYNRIGASLRSDFDYTSVGCLFKIISNKYPMQFKNLVTSKRIKVKNLSLCTKTNLSKESSQ
jgi:hypothetical protein